MSVGAGIIIAAMLLGSVMLILKDNTRGIGIGLLVLSLIVAALAPTYA